MNLNVIPVLFLLALLLFGTYPIALSQDGDEIVAEEADDEAKLRILAEMEAKREISSRDQSVVMSWVLGDTSEEVRIACLRLMYLRGLNRAKFEAALYHNLSIAAGRHAALEAAKLVKITQTTSLAIRTRLAHIMNENFWNPSMDANAYDEISKLNVAAAEALGLSYTYLDHVNAMKLTPRGRMVLLSQILDIRLTPVQLTAVLDAQSLYSDFLSAPAPEAIEETRSLIEVQLKILRIANFNKAQIRLIFLGGFVPTAPKIKISFRECHGFWS